MARSHKARKGGLAEFRSVLPQIAAELPLLTHKVVQQVAKDAAKDAIRRSAEQYEGTNPFGIEVREVSGDDETRGGQERSGAWVSGWTASTGGPGAGAHVIHEPASGIYADWYWFFGEFGTSHQPARPFMVPALEQAYAKVYPTAAAAFKQLPKTKG